MNRILFLLLSTVCIWTRAECSDVDPLAGPDSISEVKWIFAPPADNPPSNAFLRLSFNIDKPVRRAYFYTFREKWKGTWLDGKNLKLKAWPTFRNFRGHVKGDGLDITEFMTIGEHVLSFHVCKWEKGCFGMILRGEIEFEDGEKRTLLSTAKQFKASSAEEPGWKDPGFDASHWCEAWEEGDVRLTPWSRYGDVIRIYASPSEVEKYRQFQLAAGGLFPEKMLLSEPDSPNAKVVYSGDVPGIETNGRIIPPYAFMEVCLEPGKPFNDAVRNARKSGIPILGIERFNRAKYTAEDGTLNFEPFDLGIRRILALYPEARFFLYYRNGTGLPPNWAKENRDELAGFAVKSSDKSTSNYSGNPEIPSFASEVYRAQERAFWMSFGSFARSKPWGRRILGVHCGFGGSGDGMPCGANAMPDTGKRMTEAFRRWLMDKYPTDEALQKAWGNDSVTRSTACVPDASARPGSGLYIRNLADPRDRMVADYYDCYHSTFESFMIGFGKTIKSALPGCLAGTYFGYTVLGYSPEGNTARIGEILKSPYIDYFYATTRGYNLTDGLIRQIPALCRKYGKFTSIEGDVRPHNADGTAAEKWKCKTPQETRSTVGKYVSNALMFGCGWQAVDFGTHARLQWLDTPEAMETMAAGVKLWHERWREGCEPEPNDIAVVFDPDQVWKQGHPDRKKTEILANNIATYPMQTLNFSGYSYDLLTPELYVTSSTDYKAVVFLNLFETTPNMRKAIKSKTDKNGVTAVWCFAPGIATPEGYSAAAMTDLTGIELDYSCNMRTFETVDASGGSLFAGELHGTYKKWSDAPRVYSKDFRAETFSTWKDDGTAAFVRKRLPGGGVSVFAGLPIHDVRIWSKIFSGAGAHAFTTPGFYVRKSAGLLSVFSWRGGRMPPESRVQEKFMDVSGRVKVSLKKQYKKVTDVFTGEVVARNADVLFLESEFPRLWLLKTE